MRIHFSRSTDNDPRDIALSALAECQEAGTVAKHVGFKVLSVHRGGPGFAYALEIQLSAHERDRGRRLSNSGTYGTSDEFAATYDEWGFLLAAMYRHDPDMRVMPNFKHDYAVYRDAEDFHYKTGRTYDASYPDYVERYGDDFSYRDGRNLRGRRGAGRWHFDAPVSVTRYAQWDPRDADDLRKLHAGETF